MMKSKLSLGIYGYKICCLLIIWALSRFFYIFLIIIIIIFLLMLRNITVYNKQVLHNVCEPRI